MADIVMSNELMDGQRKVGVLYDFDNSDCSTAVLSAIGMTGADAYKTENGINYFTSDMLNNKLSAALTANATTVKNALEAAVKNGGVAMTETDATGHTSASDMEQGLYLVVEIRVPENVTSTCNPFFVSLPTPVQTNTDAEPSEPQKPLNETPTAVQQPQIAPLQNALTADAVMQLLHHMSRMFRGNMPVIPPALRIDSKRRRRLQEKRMAMGHKRDDHEDEQLHHVNDNTMR